MVTKDLKGSPQILQEEGGTKEECTEGSQDDMYIKEILEEIYQSFDAAKRNEQINALLQNESFMMKARKRKLREEDKMHASVRGAMFNLLEGEFFIEYQNRIVEVVASLPHDTITRINNLLSKTRDEIDASCDGFPSSGSCSFRAEAYEVNPAVKIQTELTLYVHEGYKPTLAITLHMFFSDSFMKIPLAGKHFVKVTDIKGNYLINGRDDMNYLVQIQEEEKKKDKDLKFHLVSG